jgi:light-regulated signal transduction histidine kinase (bacteriophytochrome)
MSIEKALEEKILELERKLQKSNNDLSECKKETKTFIHIASHDLQAPLRKLSAFVERLTYKSHDALGEEALLYIDRIDNTVAAMRSLIDSLTELSEITAADIDFIQCDLNEVMNAVIRNLELLIKDNNVAIHLSPLPTIEANAEQLKTAFKNLLVNSIKFQKEDSAPQIVITSELLPPEEEKIHSLPPGTTYYKIEFADNGIGFKPEYAEKILDPFQRLHGNSTYKGNGLGLSICKKIINKHHGIMYAKGKENSGARFILILPSTYN